MRESTATVVRRAEYAPPAYRIRSVELTFDLDPAKTIVGAKLAVERNAALAPDGAPPPLRLHGEELTLLRVQIDGAGVAFRLDGGDLVVDAPPAAPTFTVEIRNTVSPEKNSALSGLFTSGGGLFTQCEAEGFRRITWFVDRPDVMAVYTVTLRAERARYPVLLANGNLVGHGDLDDEGRGRHWATWQDPHPKPSYLFALVAADLVAREQRITARSGRDHLLQIWVRRGDLDKTGHAMASLVASVAWDEARYGLALDLDRFMVVAVDDFNGGAMENKGLNVFNTKLLLASPATATDADFQAVESVVAHEYFHNWTGNRITCRDWFQLSLKEGLTVFRDQQFSMDMAGGASARAVCRIDDVRRLRTSQFPEDAGPMAHPVRPDSYHEIDNFYTATVYEKGAEVVRMMHALVGGDVGFRRGIDLYFARHDGSAVTCDDFAQAIADANPGSELASRLDAFKRWYAQSGTPVVTARGSWDAAAQRYTLTLAQHTPPTPGQPQKAPFVIPVDAALLAADGRELAAPRCLVLDEAERTWTFDGVDAAPVPSLLRGFSAPVKLDDGLTDADRIVLLTHDGDAFNRWEAGQKLVLDRLLAAVDGATAPVLDATLEDALRRVLREPSLDPAFKALALQPPGESTIAEERATFDPQRIHAVREGWLAQLAERLADDWRWAFDAHAVREGYAPTHEQAGRRALANLALQLLCLNAQRHGDPVWPGRALQRVKDATNFTDRAHAVQALLGAQSPLAANALVLLRALAGGDALLLDKWFALQAGAPEPVADVHGRGGGAVFDRVRELLHDRDFTRRNPNRVWSLLRTFFANPGALHRADGAGVALWAEEVLAIDAINASVAARLSRACDRWSALAEPYRGAARAAVERVAARANLSNGVREVVGNALETWQ